MRQIKVYFASKRHHADMLRALRPDGFHFNGRWLETANLAINATKPASHWLEENFSDIKDADFVVVYAEKGEVLKTALVEVGWAIAWGRPVIVIGHHESYEPWCRNKARVSYAATLEDALLSIKRQVCPPDDVSVRAGGVSVG